MNLPAKKELTSWQKKFRHELVEKIVEQDDALTHEYLEGKNIPVETLKATLRKAVIANKIFPVFTGSALKNKREEVKKVFAGEIAAAVGLKEAKTSHTLCDEQNPIVFEAIKFADPVISLCIEPKTKADQEKMGYALKRLSDEDPTFKIKSDQETGETVIMGMGELQLEIMVDRLKREFSVEANVG